MSVHGNPSGLSHISVSKTGMAARKGQFREHVLYDHCFAQSAVVDNA